MRKDRTLEKIIFPIPDVCHYLTDESKNRVMADTGCNEQGSKVDDFFKRTNELYEEMECQKDLRGDRCMECHFMHELKIYSILRTYVHIYIHVCMQEIFC